MYKKNSVIAILLSAFSTIVLAEQTANHPYLSVFGGGGVFSADKLNQTGVALFDPGQGGPLSVNANGAGSTSGVGIVGVNAGYPLGVEKHGLTPALEVEGYYLGGTQTGDNLVNVTDRLPEHDFTVKYPMNTGVFLANAVVNFGHFCHDKLHSYAGLGVGTAVVSISGADSTQISPPEAGINHYNSNPNASDWTFATQAKMGLNYALTQSLGIFAEYRFLYLSPTSYTFGSTQYPTHTATTSWDVNISGLYNNMGAVGLQYKF